MKIVQVEFVLVETVLVGDPCIWKNIKTFWQNLSWKWLIIVSKRSSFETLSLRQYNQSISLMDLPQIIIGCGKISRKIVGFYSKYTKENMCKKEMPKKRKNKSLRHFREQKMQMQLARGPWGNKYIINKTIALYSSFHSYLVE